MISNRCARKSLVTNCNSIISKNHLRFLVDSNETAHRRDKLFQVSIPYSSIKRGQATHISMPHRCVSIPYSSIKRLLRLFLRRRAHVSIPYSSIKRNVQCHCKRNAGRFQFHIVRLKDSCMDLISSLISCFNSI